MFFAQDCSFLFCLYKSHLSGRRVHPCNEKYQKMNQRVLSSISAAVVSHNENDDTAQYDGSFFSVKCTFLLQS